MELAWSWLSQVQVLRPLERKPIKKGKAGFANTPTHMHTHQGMPGCFVLTGIFPNKSGWLVGWALQKTSGIWFPEWYFEAFFSDPHWTVTVKSSLENPVSDPSRSCSDRVWCLRGVIGSTSSSCRSSFSACSQFLAYCYRKKKSNKNKQLPGMLLCLTLPRTGDHINILVLRHLPKTNGFSRHDGAGVSQLWYNGQSSGSWGVFSAEMGFFI